MVFIQLGNGSALNPININSSFLIEGSDSSLLIDCGYNVYRNLFSLYNYKKIRYIYITHMDDDHIGSLRALMYDLYFNCGIIPTIIVDQSLYYEMSKYLEMHTGVVEGGIKKRKKLYDLHVVSTKAISKLTLGLNDILWYRTFKNLHYQNGAGISFWSNKTRNAASITGDTVPCHNIVDEFDSMSSNGFNYTMYHDFSNWNEPSKQVHSCKDSIKESYPTGMIEKLKYYHNDEEFTSLINSNF